MPTTQERLDAERAELQPLIEEFNTIGSSQQEKLQIIQKKQARLELLEQIVAEGD